MNGETRANPGSDASTPIVPRPSHPDNPTDWDRLRACRAANVAWFVHGHRAALEALRAAGRLYDETWFASMGTAIPAIGTAVP